MIVGDILRYQGQRWQVISAVGEGRFRATSWEGQAVELESDDQDVEVVVHPASTWPFLTVSEKPACGPLMRILRPQGRSQVELAPLVDWVPASRIRSGGPVFFNPRLKLHLGEVLTGVFQNEQRVRVPISRGFMTQAKRKARANPPPKITTYDRILQDDDDDF